MSPGGQLCPWLRSSGIEVTIGCGHLCELTDNCSRFGVRGQTNWLQVPASCVTLDTPFNLLEHNSCLKGHCRDAVGWFKWSAGHQGGPLWVWILSFPASCPPLLLPPCLPVSPDPWSFFPSELILLSIPDRLLYSPNLLLSQREFYWIQHKHTLMYS